MKETGTETTSIPAFGAVDIPMPAERPVSIEMPAGREASDFFPSLLDSFERTGGMPRLLFVGASGGGPEAGAAAVCLARAAAERRIDVLLVDGCFDEPALRKPYPYQPDEGFADMVVWGSSVQGTIRTSPTDSVRMITAGSPPPDSNRFFSENDIDSALITLREQAQLVLVIATLRNDDGEYSSLLSRADRTLVVRQAGTAPDEIPAEIPVGRAVEIIVEKPGAQRSAQPDLADASDADRQETARSAESSIPVTAPVSDSGTPRGAAEEDPERPNPKRVASTEKRSVPVDVPAGAPARANKSTGRTFPIGKWVLGIVLGGAAVGVLLAFFWMQSRFTPESERMRMAEMVPQLAPEAIDGDLQQIAVAEEPVPEIPAGVDIASAAAPPGEDSEMEQPREEQLFPVEPEARQANRDEVAEETPMGDADPAAAPEQPVATHTGPGYGVHVESFPTETEAAARGRIYESEGVTVNLVKAEVPGKGTWYRIVLGHFASRSEANRFSSEVKERFNLHYTLVVKNEL